MGVGDRDRILGYLSDTLCVATRKGKLYYRHRCPCGRPGCTAWRSCPLELTVEETAKHNISATLLSQFGLTPEEIQRYVVEVQAPPVVPAMPVPMPPAASAIAFSQPSYPQQQPAYVPPPAYVPQPVPVAVRFLGSEFLQPHGPPPDWPVNSVVRARENGAYYRYLRSTPSKKEPRWRAELSQGHALPLIHLYVDQVEFVSPQ